MSEVTILDKITDSAAVIVQHQIKGTEIQMVINVSTGAHRIITFDMPEEDCTVNDLLKQVEQETNIYFDSDHPVYLVNHSSMGKIYVADGMEDLSHGKRDTDSENECVDVTISDRDLIPCINSTVLDYERQSSGSPWAVTLIIVVILFWLSVYLFIVFSRHHGQNNI